MIQREKCALEAENYSPTEQPIELRQLKILEIKCVKIDERVQRTSKLIFSTLVTSSLKQFNIQTITTGNNRFAECIPSGTRQKRCLPSAAKTTLSKIMALGKQSLCRVLKKTTRQTRKKHSVKERHSATNRHVDIRQLVCRPLGVCRVSVC